MEKYMTFVFIVPSLLLIFIMCSPSSTQLVERYPVIYNGHNVKKIVSLYSDDATFEVVGQFILKGKNQIRDITEYDSVLNIHMSIRNIKANGDTIFCDISETNDWLKISEIEEAHYTAIFIFQGGLIKYIRAEAKPETQQAFNQVLSPLIEWARDNNANVLREMMPEGKFIYSAENAKKTLALLRSWKDSLLKP